jgi:BirA family biotin operon repressor/biotin-[acetyl-CoA-carboxylase] ligase
MNRPDIEKAADRLIAITRERPNVFFERTDLMQRLGIDAATLGVLLGVTATWKYKLEVDSSLRVAFVSAPDALTETEIRYRLGTASIGSHVVAYRSVKSTNDLACEAAEAGAREGTIFTAEEQTSGRGRLGRSWHSPYGSGIYVSVVLRPTFPPQSAPGTAIMTGVALADTLLAYAPGQVRLKWPNDVLLNGRKVAGILTELGAEDNEIQYLVIGVGINVNLEEFDFPPELRPIATSLRRELGKPIRRVELLQAFLRNLEREYTNYQQDRLLRSHDRIREYSALIGHSVALESGKILREGLVKDIDSEGRLILETIDGPVPIIAGEVTVVKRPPTSW